MAESMPSGTTATYSPHELVRMLEAAGLVLERAWGNFDGDDLGMDTPRAILLTRKPG